MTASVLSSSTFRRCLFAGLLGSALFHSPARADGPGLGNLTYSSSELSPLKPISVLTSNCSDGTPRNNSYVLMHRGYLFVVAAKDSGNPGGSLEVYNFSNPRSPGSPLFKKCDSVTNPLREMHRYGLWRNDADGKDYIALPSTKGIQIWNITNPLAPTLAKDMVISGITASDYADGTWWVVWQAPYIYVAGSGNGLYIVNAADPLNPTVVKNLVPASVGDFRTNIVEVIGNVMITAGTDTAPGFATFDLSDPVNPVLKSKISNPQQTYHYLLAGSTSNPSKLYAFARGLTIYDLSNLSSIGTVYDNPNLITTKIGYLNYQDGYIHGGYSASYRKINVNSLTAPSIVRTGTSTVSGADEDFGTVLGNVVFLGNDHDSAGAHGSAIYPHQQAPDTTPPAVTFVSPTPGATNQKTTSRVGVLFSDNVDIRSLTTTTFIVRPVGGSALPGRYTQTFHTVNFAPNAPLQAGTTYEVVINGVKDWAGNTMTAAFVSTFTTAGTVALPPANCNLGADSLSYVGANITFTASGCTGGGLSYSFDFGDGTSPTAFSGSNTASHSYAFPQHHTVTVTVANTYGETSDSRRQTVVYQPTAKKPTRSTPIFYDDTRTPSRIHVVNPDRNSVRSFDASTLDNSTPSEPVTGAWEVAVGRTPKSLAVRPGQTGGGDLWIVSQEDPTVRVVNGGTGACVGIIRMPNGSRPYGIAFDPAGTYAYVTLEGTGKLAKINAAVTFNSNGFPTAEPIVAQLDVGGRPRGIAVSGDGQRILVTRFISGSNGGEVREISGSTFSVVRTTSIADETDAAVDTESNGRGRANYLQSITIAPDGRHAVVPSKKDNIFRGLFRDGQLLNFENTVRTMVSVMDLVANPPTDLRPYRRDINNADMANSAVYASMGDWVFIAHHNNQVSVYDALNYNATNVMELATTGMTPQGLAIKPDNSRLYVWNFMSRTIETYDITQVGLSNNFTKKSSVSAQTSEALPANVLAGKKVFYNSADTRMSRDGYIACASCHLDGGGDDTVFDFTDRGEGLRNTVTMLGRRGTGHGRVHWSANFDEIQDFEHDVRGPFGGSGFMTDAAFNSGTRNTPLGDPKAGASADLDNLAAYVTSLTIVPRSPYRNDNGTLTAAAEAGRQVFQNRGCASCHSGRDFTDSSSNVLHNVGTIKASSGKRLGGTLTGIDTPTLLGVWNTAPYLHDGSAATLLDVLGNTTHVGTLSAQERSDLQSYLLQVDDMGRDFTFSSFVVNDTANAASWTFRADLASGDHSYGDRGYLWETVPALAKDATWIRTASASKTYATSPVASFAVDQQVDVYLAIDDRMTTKPTWVSGDGWADTNQDITLKELNPGNINPTLRTLSLFKKTFAAGTVMLKALNTTSIPMYTVIVKATPPGAVPAAPTGLAAVASDRQVTLSWVASSGALSYTIRRGTTPGSLADIRTNITSTSFVDTGLSNGITYYYAVKAVNAAGASGDSAQASATPTCTLPAPPSGLTATAGALQATLSWNAVAGASYNLKRATVSSTSPPTVATVSTNLYTNTGLTAGTSYFYRVSAVNSCGESANSAEVSVTPLVPSANNVLLVVKDADAATAGVQLTSGDALIGVELQDLGFTVTAVADAASTSTDASGRQLVVISSSVTSGNVAAKFDVVTVPVLVNEGAVYMDMRLSGTEAVTRATGQTTLHMTGASPLAGGLTGDPIVTQAPAPFTVGAPGPSADNAVTLSSDPTKSAVFAYEAGAALTTGTAPARRVAFFLDDLGNGSPATADLLNATGWGLFASAVEWATGSATAAPPAPTSLAVTSTSGQANLSWTGSSGATGYRVKRSTQSGGSYTVLATVSGTSYSDSGVSNGTTYYYVVSAVNAIGESPSSNEAQTTPGCTLAAPPTNLTATSSGGSVTLTWTVVPAANSYRVKRSTTSGGPFTVIASGVTTSTYVSGDASATYYYVVSSVNACGESANSGQAVTAGAGPYGGTARPVPGTIQAEDYDLGGQGVGFNDTTTGNIGGAYRTATGENVDIYSGHCGATCYDVGSTAAGEWTSYTVSVASAGVYTLQLRVATTATRTMRVEVNGADVTGTLSLPNTGAYTTFSTFTAPKTVSLRAGLNTVRMVYLTGSTNLDWFSFTGGAAHTNTYFEAETGSGAGTSPMAVVNDAAASGGKAIWSPTSSSSSTVPSNGHVKFSFTAGSGGVHKVWGRFLVGPAATSDDSLWVRFDSGTWILWNNIHPRVQSTSAYSWDSVHDSGNGDAEVTFSLAPGAHTLEVAYREDGLKMDRFLVTTDLTTNLPAGQ